MITLSYDHKKWVSLLIPWSTIELNLSSHWPIFDQGFKSMVDQTVLTPSLPHMSKKLICNFSTFARGHDLAVSITNFFSDIRTAIMVVDSVSSFMPL